MAGQELLERDVQLDALRSQLRATASGNGRLVLLGGEAGIGKSALVRRFCRDVERDARILVGACEAMQTARPLGPLLDMADALGPGFLRLLAGETSRARAFDDLLQRLRERPTVAVIEDVHWADDATLDLLRFLGRRVDATRGLVIATYRRDEVGPRHPLGGVLGDLTSAPAVTRLHLPPLSPEAVAELAAATDVDAAELHRITGGNPFFVTEVVAAGGARLPTSVSDAVAARAARLPSDARAALEAAGVAGAQVDPALLGDLGHGVDAVEACLAGGLLAEVDGRLGFRHELVREAIVRSLSEPRRRALHAAILAALSQRPEAGTDPATLAHHAEAARDAAGVLRFAPAAARRAAALGAHREARAQYERVLPYAARLSVEDQAALLASYADECDHVDRLPESVQARRQAIERWRAAGRTERWAHALSQLAQTFVALGENAAADDASTESVETLERLGASPSLASAYWIRAHLRMLDRDTGASVAWGRRAIALAAELGDVAVLAGAHMTVACSLMFEDHAEYAGHFEQCAELARRHGLHQLLVSAHGNRGSGAGELRRLDEAERYLREALDLAVEHDLDRLGSYVLAWLALTRLHQGAWDEAGVLLTEVLRRSSTSAITRIMALVAVGRLRTRRGDPEAAEPLDEALRLAAITGTLQRLAPVHAARAELAWWDGDVDRVRREAAAVYDLAEQRRHPWFLGELGYWRWRAGDAITLPAVAAEPYRLQTLGRAREAAAAWRALGCPFESAFALSESDIEQDVRQAVAAYDRLGARVAAQRAREQLRALGATRVPRPPRASTQGHPAGLTPREAQVLALLVRGLTNAEIAAHHRVSPRTVDHQVSAVLDKLDVRSRTEAVAEAHRRGLLPAT
jgi:DNA-binding CsgD family transcriptional regulator/tetratricopeptide (TPR) repeat protein